MHTILVADDSVTIQKAVEIVFDKEPFQVVKASSAAEALAKARDLQPHIVLVDHLMPDMNGYEIAESLRNDSATASIRVLLLSSNTTPYDEGRALAAGVVGHLPKPFDCQTLLDRVRAALGVATTVHGTFGPSAVAAAPASSMPRPPGVGAMPRPPGVAAARPAPSRPVSLAEQNDPFGFGGALHSATTPPVPSEPVPSGNIAPVVAPAAATRSAPATPFASNPFGASTSAPMTSPLAVSAFVATTPSVSAPPVSSSSMRQSAFTGAPQTSSAPKNAFAEAEFLEGADLGIMDVGATSGSLAPSHVSGVPASSPAYASTASANVAPSNGAALSEHEPTGPTERSTSKVDLQHLASLDAKASTTPPPAGPIVPQAAVVDRAVEAVVQRAGAVLAQQTTPTVPSREVLTQEARDIVERIAWEVVPELAEVIIREEIKRLLGSR